MKKATLIIAGVLISILAFSQSKKAEEILKEVSQTTKSYRTLKLDFTYEMINDKADIHEKERGELKVQGEKYRLNIAGQVVINDGETMWTYIQDANEVQLNSVEEEDESVITPTRLLSEYTDDFKPKLTGEQLWMSTTVYLIELRPKEEKTYDKVELKVDKKEMRILQITIYDKNDNRFIYTLQEYKPNILFDPGDFKFDPKEHPGVEVIDMRL